MCEIEIINFSCFGNDTIILEHSYNESTITLIVLE